MQKQDNRIDGRFPNGIFTTHIRFPQYIFNPAQPVWLNLESTFDGMEAAALRTKPVGEPVWDSINDIDTSYGVRNLGGFSIAWTLDKRTVKCAVSVCSRNDNFNKIQGADLAKERLFKLTTEVLKEEAPTFSFPLPDNVCITNVNGVCYVEERNFPFMEMLRSEFCDWVARKLKFEGHPTVVHSDAGVQLLYFVNN